MEIVHSPEEVRRTCGELSAQWLLQELVPGDEGNERGGDGGDGGHQLTIYFATLLFRYTLLIGLGLAN